MFALGRPTRTYCLHKIDQLYKNPVPDIFVSDTVIFIIRVLAYYLPTGHEICKNYNSSYLKFESKKRKSKENDYKTVPLI